jgi:uncharacterized protein YgbK (DUF1537 family)
MRVLRLGVIADDLTGSCDTGVQFAQLGFSSVVRIDPARADPTEVAILCTNSRNDPPDVARSKVRYACGLLAREQREFIYKKIDSTLQGNLWPELEEAMRCCGCSLAIVAPAFPALGRTMAGGWLRVGGSPTPNPVHLPTLLRKQGAPNVTHVGGALPRSDSNELIERFEKAAATAGSAIAVVDVASQHDLAFVILAAATLRSRSLMVGSAGLAAEMANLLAKEHGKQAPRRHPASAGSCGSVVLVLGSIHPATTEQIGYLVASRPTAVVEYPGRPLGAALGGLVKKAHLVVRVGRNDNGPDLGELATILGDQAIRGVILSGGDTADRVCRALKVTGIRLEREILPGIPLGRFEGGSVNGMMVATKAGGFGGEDALAVVTDFLTTQERPLR